MGALDGLRVIEIASIGPGPFCAMMLADHGADVLRVERPGDEAGRADPLLRGRPSVTIDLKHPDGSGLLLRLVERADVLIEGFRPGVAERLGIGPGPCRERNPRLVYGRMTGWGQVGPLANTAGHDINYIAVAGVLGAVGRARQPPTPPLNLVADFGGGGLVLAFGLLAALWDVERSGEGQVIDAAMVDGAALLTAMHHGMAAAGNWSEERGANLLDSGAPFYDVYETADGQWVAVGALEPQFFGELIQRMGLDVDPSDQYDRSKWPELRRRLAQEFVGRTREEWVEAFEGSDACFAPVLTLATAGSHPHNRTRGTFVEIGGVTQPAPAPRMSRTGPTPGGTVSGKALAAWEVDTAEIEALQRAGVVG